MRFSKWVIPFCASLVVVIAGWLMWRRSHPPLDPVIVRRAEEVGANPQDLAETFQLMQEAEDKHSLPAAKWQRLKQLLASDNYRIQSQALSVMMLMGSSPYRVEILSLSKPFLQDSRWQLQDGALILLRRFNDPSWRDESTKRLNSPDENIRSNARVQLRLGSGPLKRQ